MQKLCVALTVAATALSVAFAAAEEPASIAAQGNAWTLRNDTMQARVSFAEGKLAWKALRIVRHTRTTSKGNAKCRCSPIASTA